ncbi:carbon starvation protein A [candidate division KSB1 bacterium]|nr:MAG: carbon starvation protein A [candidate division KSB1 bacterium]
MNVLWILVISLILLILGYRFYGKFISKSIGVDSERKTPAHTMRDGVDYVPAKTPVLLGHHFASIAGAAPIIGPVTAAVYGWFPVLLWVVFGGIFLGAVHDFSSLLASVRHQGRSIGEVIEERVGHTGKLLFLVFSFFALILVVSAFTIIVAKTFVKVPEAATSSALFILLALLFGLSVYRKVLPLSISTIIGVILLFLCVYIGLLIPIKLSFQLWVIILLIYIFFASVTPVWILLQPRDYLNSFLLYTMIIGALIGIFISRPSVHLDGYTAFHQNIGYLFPILFVTVACGAISGFHSLVASGTTAKQLNNEKDARVIGYGAMLIESLLAVIALITAAIITREKYHSFFPDPGPVALFAEGVGGFLSKIGFPLQAGISFTALAVSAFALTSLDTATRLARFSFQEFFIPRKGEKPSILCTNRFIGTIVVVIISGALAYSGKWQAIWPLFGSANQLLAAIALLAVSVWLASMGKRNFYTKYPMVFMFAVTLTALVIIFFKNISTGNYILSFLAVLLLAVAIILGYLSSKKLFIRTTT